MLRAEIQALIDAAPDGKIGMHQAGFPVVSIPYGHHEAGPTLVADRPIILDFNGGVLLTPDGIPAIHFTPNAWGAKALRLSTFGTSQDAIKHGITRPVNAWTQTGPDTLVVLTADIGAWVPMLSDRLRLAPSGAWYRPKKIEAHPAPGPTQIGWKLTMWTALPGYWVPYTMPPAGAALVSWTSVPAVLVEAHGVEVDIFSRFTGMALRVYGTAMHGTNANCVQGRVRSYNCDTAVHYKGGDTNAGRVEILADSGRIGFLDESFLGNASPWVSFHALAEHAYWCPVGANYSTFAGSYMEADCGLAFNTPGVSPDGVRKTLDDGPNTTWLGGSGAVLAKIGTRVGLSTSRVRFGDVMPNGDTLNVTIPHAAVEAALTAERKKQGTGALIDGFRLRWTQLLKACGVEVYATHGGPGLTRPFGWTSVGHSAGFGHARANAEAPPGPPHGVEIPKPPE